MKLIDHLDLIELAEKDPIKYLSSPSFQSRFKQWLKKLLLFLLIVFLIFVGAFLAYQRTYAGRVFPGVYLGKTLVGGMNEQELKDKIEPVINQVENKGLIFIGQSVKGKKEVAVKSVLIAVNDPDLSRRVITFDLDDILQQAMAVGRHGSIFQRIGDVLIAQANGYHLEAAVQIDEQELKNNLKDNLKDLEQDSNDASFQLAKSGDIKIIEDQAGYFFDLATAIEQVKNNLEQTDASPIEIKLINFAPTIRTSDIEKMEPKIHEALDSAPLTLRYQDQKWPVSKNLLSQWLTFKKGSGNVIELALDPDKISLYLQTIAKNIDQPALDAKFKLESGRVIEFQPSQAGLQLTIDKNVQEIVKQILSNQSEIDLIVETAQPQILTQDLNDLGIKELIGRGTSNFAGSPKNRRINIAVGAKKLNGILIKPGEEFSLIKALGNIDAEAGFLPELVIKGDRTIPEFGGGLCQIGTTTFRAALYSGLPITARTPHSYRVVYYEPAGMDATIYNPQPDLRFINDTGVYILFETKIEGDNLIFEFYGTSDGRKIDIGQPKLFNIVAPGAPLEIKTLELKPGEKKKLETAHAGADAELSRTITYTDGTTKTQTWKSHYRPWQEVWLVGVASLDNTVVTTPDQLQQP
ncbi:MAG: VanW family protein [Patescibacteria group bacterium]|nr:VanW family protein [Patescibacteria group bacterium]MDD5121203.1 VanW family protein [Patescibacteria group bacterium]MDD5221768.1 VanW family protein [Patescibacteria group bacterium]MDD5395878.1 VanW family protein [Patescibacteria group bacterium]